MGLRDKLAVERSRLANERTLLAYIRTAIVFFATGITMFKLFFDDPVLLGIGALLTVLSIVMVGFGIYFYKQTKKHLEIDSYLPKKRAFSSKR